MQYIYVLCLSNIVIHKPFIFMTFKDKCYKVSSENSSCLSTVREPREIQMSITIVLRPLPRGN